MRRQYCFLGLLAASLLAGCGGSGSTTGSGGSPGGSTTPDAGTLATMDDTYQFKFKNVASGMVLGISAQSQTAGANLVQESDTGTADALWHFMPMGAAQYNVENLLTHQVMGIANASTAAGAKGLQWADNGTQDHLWQFYQLANGNYLIRNVNSGLYLEDADSNTTSTAIIDQGARATTGAGCSCQEWTAVNTKTPAYPAPRVVAGTGIYVHDPYMLQDPATHAYWLYGTHQTLAYSPDGKTFTFTTATTPQGACTAPQGTAWLTVANHCPVIGPDFSSWTGLQTPKADNNSQNTDIWAPSLLYANGTYYQYYSIPYLPSTGAEAVIGLATSSTPWGPWTDEGYLVTSWTGTTSPVPSPNPWNFTSGTAWNAIDPAPFVDADGNWWMVFGSWNDGTHLVQLKPGDGQRADANMHSIANRPAGEEGPFIYYWSGYYYYFAPINICCSGTNSTYRTIVGRSKTVTGPYLDRGGMDLKNGGGTILVSSHGNIFGPGGGSVFTDAGADGTQSIPTFVYHYYDGNNNGAPTLGINQLGFDSDGWPYLK